VSHGFAVHHEALHRAAAAFDNVAGDLATGIGSFSDGAGGISADTFGHAPGGQDAWGAYLRTAQDAIAGLHGVHRTLTAGIGEGLRGVARNYEAADQASNMHR